MKKTTIFCELWPNMESVIFLPVILFPMVLILSCSSLDCALPTQTYQEILLCKKSSWIRVSRLIEHIESHCHANGHWYAVTQKCDTFCIRLSVFFFLFLSFSAFGWIELHTSWNSLKQTRFRKWPFTCFNFDIRLWITRQIISKCKIFKLIKFSHSKRHCWKKWCTS